MLEVLQLLKDHAPDFKKVIPIVVTLLFSEESKKKPNIRFANELTEIVTGVYNTRAGRSKTSRAQLKRFAKMHNNGVYIDAPLNAFQDTAPMNWVLSRQSLNNIKEDVQKKLLDSTADGFMKSFLRKDLKYRRTN
ncbi:MAG: hypothetical protein EOO43_20920 [Flavobacterium sp.]|nr:MAG: hypothetical protein EOO43_20920 [Flavobacterium sp.]